MKISLRCIWYTRAHRQNAAMDVLMISLLIVVVVAALLVAMAVKAGKFTAKTVKRGAEAAATGLSEAGERLGGDEPAEDQNTAEAPADQEE